MSKVSNLGILGGLFGRPVDRIMMWMAYVTRYPNKGDS